MEGQQKEVNITIEQPASIPAKQDSGVSTSQIIGGVGVLVIGGLLLELLRRKFWPKKG